MVLLNIFRRQFGGYELERKSVADSRTGIQMMEFSNAFQM